MAIYKCHGMTSFQGPNSFLHTQAAFHFLPVIWLRMIRELFTLFYEPLGVDKDEIVGLAGRFASEVPSEIFTAAAIQKFLLKHKDAPEIAVSSAADWVRKSRDGFLAPVSILEGIES